MAAPSCSTDSRTARRAALRRLNDHGDALADTDTHRRHAINATYENSHRAIHSRSSVCTVETIRRSPFTAGS